MENSKKFKVNRPEGKCIHCNGTGIEKIVDGWDIHKCKVCNGVGFELEAEIPVNIKDSKKTTKEPSVEEMNEVIAEFMDDMTQAQIAGVEGQSIHPRIIYGEVPRERWYYHHSWDWLMPVVKKIQFSRDETLRFTIEYLETLIRKPINTIVDMHEAVYEFIKKRDL